MPSKRMLKGIALAEGVVLGNACLYKEDILEAVPRYHIQKGRVKEEQRRLLRAIEKTKKELQKVYDQIARSLGPWKQRCLTSTS